MEILLPLKGERLAPDYGPWWTPRGVLWATGFRPFFLLAPALAVLLMPWWAAVLAGRVKAPTAFDPISWHAHEMLFGYAIAIIAGFLLTAVPKWTNRPIAEPKVVMALTGLWLAGRLAMNLPGLPTALVAVVDLAFLPALAWVVAKPIIGSRSRHNYAFVALLSLASLANLALHLRAAGELLHHAGELADADNLAARQVGHMRPADEGQQVVFAHRMERDIAEDDHLVILLGEVDVQMTGGVLRQAAE